MIRRNIHAHTEHGVQLPAYLSINEVESGAYSVTVRSRGKDYGQMVQLDADQLRALSASLQVEVARLDSQG